MIPEVLSEFEDIDSSKTKTNNPDVRFREKYTKVGGVVSGVSEADDNKTSEIGFRLVSDTAP